MALCLYGIKNKKAMEKTPLSIRIIFVVSRCILICAIFFCLVNIYISTGLFTGNPRDNSVTTVSLPLISKNSESGTAYFYGKEVGIKFVNAHAELEVFDAPRAVLWITGFYMILVALVVLYFSYLFYLFIRNVRDGKIFSADNFKLLRKIGTGLLVLSVFTIIAKRIWEHAFYSEAMIRKVSIAPPEGNFWPLFVSALFLLTLAHIFQKGLELKAENELTI